MACDEELYRRGFNQPLVKCIVGEECIYILREVHEGICSSHSGGGSLARLVKIGDLVLRKVMPNTKMLTHGVFRTNWEGFL